MKKLLSGAVASLAVLATLTGAPTAAKADAPAISPKAPAAWRVKPGAVFSDPLAKTSPNPHYIFNQIGGAIDHAPAGSTITIATYSFTYSPMATQLINAHKRGVIVKILLDGHADTTADVGRLRKELGTTSKSSSFLKVCEYSCMSSKVSLMHAKMYLFSAAGASKSISMVSSANPAYSGETAAWNNVFTTVDDDATYKSNIQYFADMLPDKDNPNYYRTTAGKNGVKSYYFPRAGSTDATDNFYQFLSDVNCKTVKGYGDDAGHTTIQITAYRWTTLRIGIANKLSAMQAAGCKVEIIYSADTVDKPITRVLLTKGRVIPTYNARLDLDRDGDLDHYMHSKEMLVSGSYGGHNRHVVFTGSANFSANSIRESNEITMRIEQYGAWKAYYANFQAVKKVAKKVTSVPSMSPGSTGHELDRGDDYVVETEETK